jgi:hypothetical protein
VTAACAQCRGEQFRLADPSAPHTYRSVLARLAQETALRAGTYGARARAARSRRKARAG